ncbi:recombinase family protein [Patescibacteria group bacterium]|nr:recombinase family protein [Patescibacteria group bacterium]
MKTALNKGVWCFKAPYGYLNIKDTFGNRIITPDNKKAKIVKFIFTEYMKGLYTFNEIAKKVNATFKVKMHPQLIVKILENKLYYGWIEIKKWHIFVKGQHEPIVSEELFNKVQAIRKGWNPRKQTRNRNHPDFPLRGIKCANCGCTITGGWTRGKTGKRYAYYNCVNKKCSKKKSVSKEVIEDNFTKFLQQFSPDDKNIEVLKKAIKIAFKDITYEISKQNNETSNEVDKLKQRKQKLIELKLNGNLISDEEFTEHKTKIENDIQHLQLSKQADDFVDVDIEHAIDFGLQYIKNLPYKWKELDTIEFKVLRSVLFPKNVFYENKIYQTPELCVIYQLKKTSRNEKSSLVAPRGIEPLFSG